MDIFTIARQLQVRRPEFVSTLVSIINTYKVNFTYIDVVGWHHTLRHVVKQVLLRIPDNQWFAIYFSQDNTNAFVLSISLTNY